MKRNLLLVAIVCVGLFATTGCEIGKKDSDTTTTTTTTLNAEDAKKKELENKVLSQFNNEKGIIAIFQDTVKTKKTTFYKFDVKKDNNNGNYSTLDIYYVSEDGNDILDKAAFKKKYKVE